MANSVSQKVAFVTGAGSGMGRATAAAFVERDYAVALVDRDEKAGRAVESELKHTGAECMFVSCDIADDRSVESAVAATVEAFGGLNAAFNAAGIEGDKGHFTADCSPENWQRVINVDLTGTWHCMRHQIPQMIKSGGGAIVNCSSVAGLVGAPTFAAYTAAKHGVVGLTKAAALEYARQNIRVNAICPGMIDTPMNANLDPEMLNALLAESPMGRLGSATGIAQSVVWLCEDGAEFLTGQAIAIDGAWTSR